ncbi:MAG: phosphoribosylaminoimidazolesuccinocarboxamide synthase [Actinobacteria bacterium]|nr:phosphoribosylaminoimidazolesuccinocarboxamide synthase [Actinomycetota bacterium]MCB9411730.1 phosphoribosylaminoimidazolesuccinocarboxamide synthase [Actinomycetota bacterium]
MPTNTVPPPDYTLPDGYRHVYSGKVRDLWRTPDGDLLFVATDRISAYDWILPTAIPDKGRILTAASLWWFDQLADICGNHVVSTDVPAAVAGRAMVCKELDMVPVECVARGYLTGSGLAEYRADGTVCGVPLPAGLVDGSELPASIFTPATKAEIGEHDENISFERVAATVGPELATLLRDTTLRLYDRARGIAGERGIILADTKFEFGFDAEGSLTLADEVLTPDSSRYWPADEWQPGRPQPSFDKQFVRDWLTSPASGWDRNSDEPPPPLPESVVAATRAKYVEVYELLTGRKFV